MRGVWRVCLAWGVALLGLAACVAVPPQPFTSPRPVGPAGAGPRSYLPIFVHTAPRWLLPGQGYGIEADFKVAQQLSRAALAGWWYDWSPRCADRYQVPMVWAAADAGAVALRRCNDGRPLLILNEPERKDQANTTPVQAADLVHALADWWSGPLWCCGTNASATDWVAKFKRSYEAQYGPLPLAGWHVHAYTNDTLGPGESFATVVAPWRAEAALAHVDAFHQQFAGPVLISEHGVLTGEWWHSAQDVAPLVAAFRAGLDRRPYVVAAAWFAAYANQFGPSNLLDATGKVTTVGAAWLRAAR